MDYTTTYKWSELDRHEQTRCRKARDKMWAAGWGVSISQLAKYYDATEDYLAGSITAEEIAPIVSAVPRETPKPAPAQVTAREAAEKLGVSRSTIYRRIKAGQLAATKDNRGQWAITL